VYTPAVLALAAVLATVPLCSAAAGDVGLRALVLLVVYRARARGDFDAGVHCRGSRHAQG
jgi:hypothetical protein